MLLSNESVDEMEQQSLEGEAVGVPSSNVTIPFRNKSGKSRKAFGENHLSQKSMAEPGGGGPRLSKFSVVVLEQVSTV